jgi:Tfp pilus assembly protein PilF
MAKRKRKKTTTDNVGAGFKPAPAQAKRTVDRTSLFLIIILVAAIGMRIFYFIQNSANNPLFGEAVSDAGVYYDWAREIASGNFIHDGVFYMAPLYPYIMAGIFKVFGESISSVVVVQHVVGVINLFLIYMVSKVVFGKKAAIVTLIFAVLHAPFVFYESKMLLPTFTVFFYLLSLFLLLKQDARKPGYPLTFITGLVLGIAVIHRPNILLFIPLVLAWYFIHHMQKRGQSPFLQCVLLLIGVLIPILPVTIHNYNASGEFIPLTCNTGINFYYGANKDAAPTFTRRESISDSIEKEEEKAREIAELAEERELGPKEVSAYWMKRGFAEITDDFPRWLSYEINKLYWLINTYEIPNNYNLPFEKKHVPSLLLLVVPFGLISLLGLVGIVLANKKDSRIILLLFYLASLFIGLMIFTVVSRFRIPLTAVLVGFAGFGVIEYLKALKNRNHDLQSSKRYLAATLVIVILAIPTLVPYRKATNPSSTYYTLGILAFREGEYKQAIKYQELALQTYPIYADAYNNMGSCYKKLGDLDKAIEMYDKASDANPKYSESRFNAGLVYMEREELEPAIEKFRDAIAINPRYFKAKMNLSFALFRSGKTSEAIDEMKELVAMNPDNAQHHYNLGLMLTQVRKNDEAIKQFEIAVELDGDYQEAKDALRKMKEAGVSQ